MTQREPTPPGQWRKQTEIMEFPSGMIAEVKHPDIFEMILSDGTVPDSLMQFLVDSVSSANGKPVEWQLKKTELKMLFDMMDNITRASFVKPAIVDDPDYDNWQIALEDVARNDRLHLMNWAMGGGQQAVSRIFQEQA